MIWEPVLRAYAAARAIVGGLSLPRCGTRTTGPAPISNGELSKALVEGSVGVGDRVTISGFVSPFVNWYLPGGYSPYRFHTDYAVKGYQGALRLHPVPAILPAGHLPFRHPDHSLSFIYELNSNGLAIELSEANEDRRRPPTRTLSTPDDQPWFMNLEGSANYSPEPLDWVYFMGSGALQRHLPSEPPTLSKVLADPSLVRGAVEVPPDCQCFPVVYPRGLIQLNSPGVISGCIGELDRDALAELSRLGAPLAAKAYRLFYSPDTGSGPWCLYADSVERLPPEASSNAIANLPLAAEFFLQTARGDRLPFGDDDLVDLFLPSVKDFVYPVDAVLLPDRWVGKVYGFSGPIYVYKTGPLEVTISPEGMYCVVAMREMTSQPYLSPFETFSKFVSGLGERLAKRSTRQFGIDTAVRMTYMSDPSWQIHLGPLLETEGGGHDLRIKGVSAPVLKKAVQAIRPPAVEKAISVLLNVLLDSDAIPDDDWLEAFEVLRHNANLIPLTRRLFEGLGYSAYETHDPKDQGTDHFVKISKEPKLLLSTQVKSHVEVLEDKFNDTILAQRARSSTYDADLYLVLIFANPNSSRIRPKKQMTDGEIITMRLADLRRQLQMTEFRSNTEVVSPSELGSALRKLGLRPE